MRIILVKWLSIVALLFAFLFWTFVSPYQLALELFVSMAAGVVALQAFRVRKVWWLATFVAITCIFGIFAVARIVNPAAPRVGLGAPFGILLVGGAMTAFLGSLLALKQQTLLSMPSITDRTPGSESL